MPPPHSDPDPRRQPPPARRSPPSPGRKRDQDRSRKPSKTSRRERDPEAQRPQSARGRERLRNYRPTIPWLVIQLMAVIMLGLLLFSPPSATTALIVVGDDMVGPLKKCSGARCEDWLTIDGQSVGSSSNSTSNSDSSSNSATSEARTSGSTTDRAKRQSSSDSTTSSTSQSGSGSGSGSGAAAPAGSLDKAINYHSLFLTTGPAILVSFYMSLYAFLFLVLRYPSTWNQPIPPPPPRPPESAGTEEEEEEEEAKRTKKDSIKLFAYRAARCMGLINALLILGCLCEVLRIVVGVQSGLKLGPTAGVGGGVFLLLFAFVFTAYSALRDITIPNRRFNNWLRFLCCCPRKIMCFKRRIEADPITEDGSEQVEMGDMNREQGASERPSRGTEGDRDRKRRGNDSQQDGNTPRRPPDQRGPRI